MAVDLPGSRAEDSQLDISTDYNIDSPNNAHRVLSNVQSIRRRNVNPAASQTFGRAAEMFAFNDPLNRGTFLPPDKVPSELPHSDPGSGFALAKQMQ
jgi:hypothetical protein